MKAKIEYKIDYNTPIIEDIVIDDIGNFCVLKVRDGKRSWLACTTKDAISEFIEISSTPTGYEILSYMKKFKDRNQVSIISNFLRNSEQCQMLSKDEFYSDVTELLNIMLHPYKTIKEKDTVD